MIASCERRSEKECGGYSSSRRLETTIRETVSTRTPIASRSGSAHPSETRAVDYPTRCGTAATPTAPAPAHADAAQECRRRRLRPWRRCASAGGQTDKAGNASSSAGRDTHASPMAAAGPKASAATIARRQQHAAAGPARSARTSAAGSCSRQAGCRTAAVSGTSGTNPRSPAAS